MLEGARTILTFYHHKSEEKHGQAHRPAGRPVRVWSASRPIGGTPPPLDCSPHPPDCSTHRPDCPPRTPDRSPTSQTAPPLPPQTVPPTGLSPPHPQNPHNRGSRLHVWTKKGSHMFQSKQPAPQGIYGGPRATKPRCQRKFSGRGGMRAAPRFCPEILVDNISLAQPVTTTIKVSDQRQPASSSALPRQAACLAALPSPSRRQ